MLKNTHPSLISESLLIDEIKFLYGDNLLSHLLDKKNKGIGDLKFYFNEWKREQVDDQNTISSILKNR